MTLNGKQSSALTNNTGKQKLAQSVKFYSRQNLYFCTFSCLYMQAHNLYWSDKVHYKRLSGIALIEVCSPIHVYYILCLFR